MKRSAFSILACCLIPDDKCRLWKSVCFFLLLISSLNILQAQTVNDFTTSGSYTVPPEFAYIRVESWGGGGGGGGANSLVSLVGAAFGGGGGGAGAYNSKVFELSPSQSYTFNFTVGAGGAGAAANGGNGGATSVTWTAGGGGTMTSNGGSGGSQGFLVVGVGGLSVTINQGVGGSGGTASPGGVAGGSGLTATGAGSGKGGDSPNGGAGGASATTTNTGNNGSWGGGGSGGCINAPITVLANRAGGNGGTGRVRITAYRCNPETTSISTWSGTAWANGVPTNSKRAIINGNYNTVTHGNITACSCQVNSGTTVTVGNGTNNNYIQIYNELINNGTITVSNNSSLVQWYNSVPNTNTGTLNVYRNAKPMKRYDFTYWSSPVAGQTLENLSPGTLFDKYFSWTPGLGWTPHDYGTATMQSGKGYIVRAPQAFSVTTASNFTGVFTGAPHNGEIIVPGFQGSSSTNVWNLIGNPYPSAIDVNLFLTDPDNSEAGGTVYLWTHNTPALDGGSGIYTYTSNDYTSYNLSGGVATALQAPSTIDPEDNGNVLANGHIASGQSFFIRGVKNYEDSEPGNIPIKVKFKNSMRITGANTNFFRPGTTIPVEDWQTSGKHRLWLNLRNDEGAFGQILVGYIENATDGMDRLYDGMLFGGNYVSFYSLLDQNKLAIQGRALPFNDQDIVPLGYKTTIAGSFHISIDHFDGLFEGQDVFLKDKLLNTIHNLKEEAYVFSSAIGTFDERFEIVYQQAALGTDTPPINPEGIIVYKDSDLTIAVSSGTIVMKEIKVYDIAGRLISHQKGIDSTVAAINNLPQTHQVLIVDVLTIEDQKVVKKIVF